MPKEELEDEERELNAEPERAVRAGRRLYEKTKEAVGPSFEQSEPDDPRETENKPYPSQNHAVRDLRRAFKQPDIRSSVEKKSKLAPVFTNAPGDGSLGEGLRAAQTVDAALSAARFGGLKRVGDALGGEGLDAPAAPTRPDAVDPELRFVLKRGERRTPADPFGLGDGGSPFKINDPGLPPPFEGEWVFSKNPKNDRSGSWSLRGNQGYEASWDEKDGHWDVDDGRGNRVRTDRRGSLLTPSEAHAPQKPRRRALEKPPRGSLNAIEEEFERLEQRKPPEQRRSSRRPPGQKPRGGGRPKGRLGLLMAILGLLSGQDGDAEATPTDDR